MIVDRSVRVPFPKSILLEGLRFMFYGQRSLDRRSIGLPQHTNTYNKFAKAKITLANLLHLKHLQQVFETWKTFNKSSISKRFSIVPSIDPSQQEYLQMVFNCQTTACKGRRVDAVILQLANARQVLYSQRTIFYSFSTSLSRPST